MVICRFGKFLFIEMSINHNIVINLTYSFVYILKGATLVGVAPRFLNLFN